MPKRVPALYSIRRRWTVAEARAVVDAHTRSGLSARAFAAREGIHEQRLLKWARRLASEPASSPVNVSPMFVEITGRSTAVVEIVLRSSRVLRVSESIAPAALRRLVEALDEGSC